MGIWIVSSTVSMYVKIQEVLCYMRSEENFRFEKSSINVFTIHTTIALLLTHKTQNTYNGLYFLRSETNGSLDYTLFCKKSVYKKSRLKFPKF